MKLVKTLSTTLLAGMLASASWAEDVALLIQNAAYNPLDRIADVGPGYAAYAQAYRANGFFVIDLHDVNAEEMKRGLIEFEKRSRTADRVVIDFTGYVSTHGNVFLPRPVDSRDASLVERFTEAPSLEQYFELVRHRPGRAAVVMASPDEWVQYRIEARARIPQGVLVIGGPQKEVRFSVMNKLLRGTATNAIAHDHVWVGGYKTDAPFAAAARGAVTAPQAPAPGTSPVFTEMADWRAATNSNTEASLNAYLAKYPNGLFAREAKARLSELVPPAQRIETALNLSRAERRQIQEQLTLLGHNTRGIDGIWGNGTRRAIRAWQGAHGFEVTGFVDGRQVRVLARQAQDREAEVAARDAEAKRAAEQADLNFWQETGSGTNEAGLRAYLERFPNGLFAPQAKRALADIEARRPQEDPALLAQEQALGLTPQMRQLAERRLQAQGLNTGRVDGNFDANTRNALRQFQQAAGLRPTGYMDRDTVAALIVSSFR